jgi:acyl-CoA reductase-like NAD-dependent aldehyde dehydrogenase
MTFPPQLEKVASHVEDAVAHGAKVLTGGRRNPNLPGLFYEPTVLVDVTHDMTAMRDETFGPTIPIMKVRDAEEAVRLANDSPYGLAASVWTKDTAKGQAVARRIESGAVCVNDCLVNYLMVDVPMGGRKESGLGRRHGAEGIRKYCHQQTVVVDRFGLKSELFWYPTSPGKRRLFRRALNLLFRSGWKQRLLG